MLNDKKEKVIENLNRILEKNYDAKEGFTSAFNATDNLQLKSFFDSQIKQRISFGKQIKEKITTLDGMPKVGGSLSGDLHRAWMDMKTAIASNNEEAILESCQRGEHAAIDDYNKFLEMDHLPEPIRDCVLQQRNAILETVREIQQFENILS